MQYIISFLKGIEGFFGSYQFLLCANALSFFIKLSLLFALLSKEVHSRTTKQPWIFLLFLIICSTITDTVWILKSMHSLWGIPNDYRIVTFLLRLAWGFSIIQYQSLGLFLESLVTQNYTLPIHQKIYTVINIFICLFFIYLAFGYSNSRTITSRSTIEFIVQNITTLYVLFILITPSLYRAIKTIRTGNLPHILKTQLKILLKVLIIPAWIFDIIQVFPFKWYSYNWIAHSYTVVGLSTLLLTFAIFYCTRKLMGLRFLNFKKHVQFAANLNFIYDFKIIIEQLSHVTNIRELGHITQSFFKENFNIPLGKAKLYFRNTDTTYLQSDQFPVQNNTTTTIVETWIAQHKLLLKETIQKINILIYDEIDFTYFYEKRDERKIILQFLEKINADVFLPLYEKGNITAYIIVERHARFNHHGKQFFSSIERDEMVVFASHLSNIIGILHSKDLEPLIEREQLLKNELFSKHQEINQYKESIRTFLRTHKQKKVGIIFYKNKQFSFGNQEAKEFIDVSINKQEGHQLSKAIKQIAHHVEIYKTPQTKLIKNNENNTLVIFAVPHLDKNSIIIIVSRPSISDMVKEQIDLLHNPTEWDYLLYLQTTKSGKLVNQLIPGTGEVLLNFKIDLLKSALSKKAILLDMPEQDLLATAELIHHISLREILHILNLTHPVTSYNVAINLFGINPLFTTEKEPKQSLLEKLNETGTIFIKNIHFLNIETQEYLAEFLRYGLYRTFKSEQRVPSDVRIICSTNQNLTQLVNENLFSKNLLQELQKTTLYMPSLLTLPSTELNTLAEGFTEQAVQNNTFKKLLILTDKDKYIINHKRPTSLQELKTKIQKILIQKSKKNNIYQETSIDPAYEVTDPLLVEAARLGKKALRDKKIMTTLWNKFKNQNKIARFLGVYPSSVNRRCKEYNLY